MCSLIAAKSGLMGEEGNEQLSLYMECSSLYTRILANPFQPCFEVSTVSRPLYSLHFLTNSTFRIQSWISPVPRSQMPGNLTYTIAARYFGIDTCQSGISIANMQKKFAFLQSWAHADLERFGRRDSTSSIHQGNCCFHQHLYSWNRKGRVPV
jgi:hypothetical protein